MKFRPPPEEGTTALDLLTALAYMISYNGRIGNYFLTSDDIFLSVRGSCFLAPVLFYKTETPSRFFLTPVLSNVFYNRVRGKQTHLCVVREVI